MGLENCRPSRRLRPSTEKSEPESGVVVASVSAGLEISELKLIELSPTGESCENGGMVYGTDAKLEAGNGNPEL